MNLLLYAFAHSLIICPGGLRCSYGWGTVMVSPEPGKHLFQKVLHLLLYIVCHTIPYLASAVVMEAYVRLLV